MLAHTTPLVPTPMAVDVVSPAVTDTLKPSMLDARALASAAFTPISVQMQDSMQEMERMRAAEEATRVVWLMAQFELMCRVCQLALDIAGSGPAADAKAPRTTAITPT